MTIDPSRAAVRDPAGPAGEAADLAIEAAKIAQREAAKIPRPDPRDDPTFQLHLSMEEIAARSSFPRRNRWRPLLELDRQLSELQRRREELAARREALERMVIEATDADRGKLSVWVSSGEQGPRPAATLPALEAERDQTVATLEAVEVAINRALDNRVHHVERHRGSMVKDANREVEAAREKYLALVHELRAVRTELLDARQVEVWVSLYPDELANAASGSNEASVCLGLMKPVREAIAVTHQVAAEAVLGLLEADARVITEQLSPAQRERLGTAAPLSPESSAMWHDSDDYQEWAKKQREKLNEMAQYAHPGQLRDLGREMRDD